MSFLDNLFNYYIRGELKVGDQVFLSYYSSSAVGSDNGLVYYLSHDASNNYFWDPSPDDIASMASSLKILKIDSSSHQLSFRDTTNGQYVGCDSDGLIVQSQNEFNISFRPTSTFNVNPDLLLTGVKYILSFGENKTLKGTFYYGYALESEGSHYAQSASLKNLKKVVGGLSLSNGVWMIPCMYYSNNGSTCIPTTDPKNPSCFTGGAVNAELDWVNSNGTVYQPSFTSLNACAAGYLFPYCPVGITCGGTQGGNEKGCYGKCDSALTECLLNKSKDMMMCSLKEETPWYKNPLIISLIIGGTIFVIVFLVLLIKLLSK